MVGEDVDETFPAALAHGNFSGDEPAFALETSADIGDAAGVCAVPRRPRVGHQCGEETHIDRDIERGQHPHRGGNRQLGAASALDQGDDGLSEADLSSEPCLGPADGAPGGTDGPADLEKKPEGHLRGCPVHAPMVIVSDQPPITTRFQTSATDIG